MLQFKELQRAECERVTEQEWAGLTIVARNPVG